MAYDGSLKFDTKIDSSGFQKGISSIGDIAQKGMQATGAILKGSMTAIGGLGLLKWVLISKVECLKWLLLLVRGQTKICQR